MPGRVRLVFHADGTARRDARGRIPRATASGMRPGAEPRMCGVLGSAHMVIFRGGWRLKAQAGWLP